MRDRKIPCTPRGGDGSKERVYAQRFVSPVDPGDLPGVTLILYMYVHTVIYACPYSTRYSIPNRTYFMELQVFQDKTPQKQLQSQPKYMP